MRELPESARRWSTGDKTILVQDQTREQAWLPVSQAAPGDNAFHGTAVWSSALYKGALAGKDQAPA